MPSENYSAYQDYLKVGQRCFDSGDLPQARQLTVDDVGNVIDIATRRVVGFQQGVAPLPPPAKTPIEGTAILAAALKVTKRRARQLLQAGRVTGAFKDPITGEWNLGQFWHVRAGKRGPDKYGRNHWKKIKEGWNR